MRASGRRPPLGRASTRSRGARRRRPSRRRRPVPQSKQGHVTTSVTWHATPPTPAQRAAWRQLWTRLLDHVDSGPETPKTQDPVEPEAATVAPVGSGHNLYEDRQRVKAERAAPFLQDAIRGHPVTDKQAAYLRALGYTGPQPKDRAAAS